MSDRGIKHSPDDMRDLKWSPSEKAVARKAFDAALSRELKAVIAETKRLAARIEQPDDLWELERYLTAKRKEIDETFDYRYSVLPLVLGSLIRQGRRSEQELHGLGEDKLARIRSVVAL
jgi:Photoprotection regulator fluorescence recovery protein